jgi:hypothetical protein
MLYPGPAGDPVGDAKRWACECSRLKDELDERDELVVALDDALRTAGEWSDEGEGPTRSQLLTDEQKVEIRACRKRWKERQ